MKRLSLLLTFCWIVFQAVAQRETDFAHCFMQLYEDSVKLECYTVSPKMMPRLKVFAEIEDKDAEKAKWFDALRSMRILVNKDHRQTDKVYKKAVHLLERNKNRFHPYRQHKAPGIYTRKKGNVYVEVLLLQRNADQTVIVDFTGNIPPDYVENLFER